MLIFQYSKSGQSIIFASQFAFETRSSNHNSFFPFFLIDRNFYILSIFSFPSLFGDFSFNLFFFSWYSISGIFFLSICWIKGKRNVQQKFLIFPIHFHCTGRCTSSSSLSLSKLMINNRTNNIEQNNTYKKKELKLLRVCQKLDNL